MASIGQQFKSAREARGLTISQVAEKTHIKPTHISAMERDQFHVFASPIYARGFIKLYAECVELDPEPLLDAYREQALPTRQPTLQAETVPHSTPPEKNGRSRMPRAILRDIGTAVHAGWNRIRQTAFRYAGLGTGVILVVLFLFWGGRSAMRSCQARRHREPAEAARIQPVDETRFPLLEKPPAPYVDSDSFGLPEESTP